MRNETNIEERSASEEVNVLVSSSSYWYGPLPSSNELTEYERIIPGGAREILEMAKAEMENRHKCNLEKLRLEEKRIDKENNELMASARAGDAEFKVVARGQISSVFILVCFIIAVSVCSICKAYWAAGGLFVVLLVFSLVVVSSSLSATTIKNSRANENEENCQQDE